MVVVCLVVLQPKKCGLSLSQKQKALACALMYSTRPQIAVKTI
jgi:hypothetical protein